MIIDSPDNARIQFMLSYYDHQESLGQSRKTKRGPKDPLRTRLGNHDGYIVNCQIDKATGVHFFMPGHKVSNITITILEHVKFLNPAYGRQ